MQSMSILLLGFLIGLRHALEADHVAAVAALTSTSSSARAATKIGLVWGVGHTVTLLLFGTLVVVMDTVVPHQIALYLEFAVGIMLLVLGADVIRRVIRDRVHFHAHGHGDGKVHFHAHAHVGVKTHTQDAHAHAHPTGFPYRALAVGLMHGMAGSAALILLTLSQVESLSTALGYMLLFGLGSVLGMGTLSFVIALPLRASARGLTWMHNALQGVLGLTTVTLGAMLVFDTVVAL